MKHAFELMDLLKDVLTEVNFAINDPSILAITIDSPAITSSNVYEMRVQLNAKGFKKFMDRVRGRSAVIGEEVDEPIMESLGHTLDSSKISWKGIPRIEFVAIIPREDE